MASTQSLRSRRVVKLINYKLLNEGDFDFSDVKVKKVNVLAEPYSVERIIAKRCTDKVSIFKLLYLIHVCALREISEKLLIVNHIYCFNVFDFNSKNDFSVCLRTLKIKKMLFVVLRWV